MAGASLKIGANTSEFTTQMKQMLAQMKLVTSEYKVEAAQAKALGSQTDLLKAKKTELISKIKLQTDMIKLQDNNLTAQKQKLEELKETEQKLKEKVTQLTDAYKESVKTTGKNSEESKKLHEQLEDTKEAHAKSVNAIKKEEDAITRNTVKLNESRAALTEQETALKDTETAIENAEKKWTVFGNEIQSAGNNMDEAGNKTVSLGDIIKGHLISDAIITGIKKLADVMKQLATGAISVGSDFEAGMSQVAATMGMSAEEINNGSETFEKLKNAAKDAGKSTQFSATEASEALNFMALAGYDADKAIETLPVVLNLAAAGGMDLATASDMVTDSMSALGDSAGTTQSFVNKMAKTSQKSNTSVSQLGEALLSVGGTAKVLAGGVTEANTLLGIFADSGTKSAEGGTALRNVILSLTAPTDTAKQKIQELGLQVFDTNGNMRPLNETFKDLDSILGNMTQGDRTEVLNTIFNKVDLKSVDTLLANCGDRFDELSGYIDNADGAAEQMANTMNDNLQGKVTTLKSGLEGLGIAAYEKFETPLKQAVENITNTVSSLQENLTNGELNDALKKVATEFGEVVEKASEIAVEALPKVLDGLGWILDNGDTIASVLKAIGAGFVTLKVAKAINETTTAIKNLKLGLEAAKAVQELVNATMAANPTMLVITLVATLVAGIVTFVATNEKARETVSNVWNTVKNAIGKAVESIVGFFTKTIPDAFSTTKKFLKNNWQDILLLLVNPFAGGINLLYKHCDGFRDIVDNIVGYFTELPTKIEDAISKVINKVVAWGENVKTTAVQAVSKAIDAVVTFFSELPDKIWNAILSAIDKVRTWGTNVKEVIVQAVSEAVDKTANFFLTLPYRVGYGLGLIIGNIAKFGINLVTWATTEIPKFIGVVVTFFSELPDKIWNAILSAIDKIRTWGANVKEVIVQAVTETIDSAVIFFSELPDKIWNAILSAIDKIRTWGTNVKEVIVQAVTETINSAVTFFSELPDKIWNAILSAIDKVRTWGLNLLHEGQEAARKLVDAVVTGVSELPGKMLDVGYNIVTGVWQGICDAAGWFERQVKSFFSGIVDGVKDAMGIHSPSLVFKNEVGKYMAQGTGVGFTEELGNVENDINNSLKKLTGKVTEITPVAEVKRNTKVVALNKKLDVTEFADNSEKTVIVEITNITQLDGEEIARKTTKKVIRNVTREQKNKQKTKGVA